MKGRINEQTQRLKYFLNIEHIFSVIEQKNIGQKVQKCPILSNKIGDSYLVKNDFTNVDIDEALFEEHENAISALSVNLRCKD